MCKKTSFIPVITLLVLVIAGQGCTTMPAKFQRAQTHAKQGQYKQAEQAYHVAQKFQGSKRGAKGVRLLI